MSSPLSICSIFLLLIHLIQCATSSSLRMTHGGKHEPGISFATSWKGNSRWIAPEWWANPLYDWNLRSGSAVVPAASRRSLALLPYEISDSGISFTAQVTIRVVPNQPSAKLSKLPMTAAAGFSIGRKGRMSDFRSGAVYPDRSLSAFVDRKGRLVLGTIVSRSSLDLTKGKIKLHLTSTRMASLTSLKLTASQSGKNIAINSTVPSSQATGGVALFSDGPPKEPDEVGRFVFHFSEFTLSGSRVSANGNRKFGPILWTQYTLSENVLRLQAQLAPVPANTKVHFGTKKGALWTRLSTAKSSSLSRTATFTIPKWNMSKGYDYEVRMWWNGKKHSWSGHIRKEPIRQHRFRIGVFSCDHGYTFPDNMLVKQVQKQNPDMLYFAGDQIYEFVTGGFSVARDAKLEVSVLDFLRKYYMFGWVWRSLLKDRPSVILPDDHDMFHGNLWGHGGRKLPSYTPGEKPTTALGGYIMPGKWVLAAEKCHVGHLPPPAIEKTSSIGIKPYFTSMKYADVSFAILEDRKYKTGPFSLPKAEQGAGGNASLLGSDQEKFLSEWAQDWTDVSMKVALSQTIFCRASTHAGKPPRKNNYIQDSGAWPKKARNRAVRIMGDAKALSLHGDQHLGVLLRQGVSKYNDAGYSFMVPGTANGFPRTWWPGVLGNPKVNETDFTGKYRDPAGNPLNIVAVGNAQPGSERDVDIRDPLKTAYLRGSGYGLVDMYRVSKKATIHLYRTGRANEQFSGFPKTITIGGKKE